MMRKMRRGDREVSRESALEITDNCAFSVMSTVSPDGNPYCVPLSPAREGEWLYFHSALEGHKIDNLKHNNRVCVSCVGAQKAIPGDFALEYESAVIFGTASEITDREEKVRALELISRRYTPENIAAFDEAIIKSLDITAVWKIHIDEISGKERKPK
ncbi:MAG: pyridoxamine 5'-phosphate oxidase family protein [Treponema sp.]|jgi:nitroimidazol reductase NimA-like FMN-containing flavoprotein (pyridoxamine 5'-phosphate oxidase superfamily)|nr:pyridoxamine 5'-phosphate oxidase family protein [Treponema sp.]